MNFVKFKLDQDLKNYFCKQDLDEEMWILKLFLLSDIRCSDYAMSSCKEWIIDDSQGMATSGNCVFLEKEGDYIHLSDLFLDEEEESVKVKTSRKSLVQLLDDWKERVCKTKPKEVTIKLENNIFTIETKD